MLARKMDDSTRTHPALRATVIALAVATLAGLVWFRPSGFESPGGVAAWEATYRGTVESVTVLPCAGTTDTDCRFVEVRMIEGPDGGDLVAVEVPAAQVATAVEEGEAVVMGKIPDAVPGFEYAIADRYRVPALLWLFALFAVVVVAFGRRKGLAAIAGLAVSLLVLGAFVVPSILGGNDPVMVSIVGASAIAFLSLYSAHGFSPMTHVALLGTVGGLLATATLAAVFTDLAMITGFGSEEAYTLQALGIPIGLSDLILGGIIIGGLGVIDDATVTQASAIWELNASADLRRGELLRGGMRIGSSHVASMVNTLVLAYAGAAMPALVLFVLSERPFAEIANGEVIAAEIVRTLVGSIGLVLAVPITTWLAARTVTSSRASD